jgi:hypothetical protein
MIDYIGRVLAALRGPNVQKPPELVLVTTHEQDQIYVPRRERAWHQGDLDHR